MTLIEQFTEVANAYCAARGLSVARVSTIVFNDGSKLGDLISGEADVTTRRYEKALLWFSMNWPADLAWPDDIARPAALDDIPQDADRVSTAGAAPDLRAAPALSIREPAE